MIGYLFDQLVIHPLVAICIIIKLHKFRYVRYRILPKPAIASFGLIFAHSASTKVVKLVIYQIGEPYMTLLSRMDRWVRLQFLARSLRDSSVISSQPSITKVLMKGLLIKMGNSFFSSILTSKSNKTYEEWPNWAAIAFPSTARTIYLEFWSIFPLFDPKWTISTFWKVSRCWRVWNTWNLQATRSPIFSNPPPSRELLKFWAGIRGLYRETSWNKYFRRIL